MVSPPGGGSGEHALRHLLKFCHTVGAIGLIGSMACLLVLISLTPPPAALAEYALMHRAMGIIATWIFLPSLGSTLIAGLLAIALNRGFHNAGWAWVKLATGILIFEGGFVGILGPLQEESKQTARAIAGVIDPSTLMRSMNSERNTLWVILAVATVNVILGIWRPRLTRLSGRSQATRRWRD